MNQEVLPNFLIVGAAKAGTTSLYYWLKQHPDVFMSEIKEPSFFVNNYGMSDQDKYISLFQPGKGKKAVGEASVAYLVAPESSQLIYNLLGKIKIIILLRNPVERALSLYAWMVMEGYEWLTSFEQGLLQESKRFIDQKFRINNPEFFWDYMYFRSGLYFEQIKRYIDLYGKELVKIVIFEELVNQPYLIYQEICNFLEINPNKEALFTCFNASQIPASIKLQFFLKQFKKYTYKIKLDNFLLNGVIEYGMTINKNLGYKPKLDIETKQKLYKMYEKDIEKITQFIVKDLSIWEINYK
jgi:hypothetical protein